MSGGGGGGGPTVSHEPGVRNEPLLIAGLLVSCSFDVSGQRSAAEIATQSTHQSVSISAALYAGRDKRLDTKQSAATDDQPT